MIIPLEVKRRELGSQFEGKSPCCFQLVMCIVKIRRKLDLEKDLSEFRALLATHQDELLAQLNTRWLVSICDTLSDHGTTPGVRATATMISAFVNALKLAESERRLMVHPKTDKQRLELFALSEQLFDGMTMFNFKGGDMVPNLLNRMESVTKGTPFLHQLWLTILERLKKSENMIGRLQKPRV